MFDVKKLWKKMPSSGLFPSTCFDRLKNFFRVMSYLNFHAKINLYSQQYQKF